VDYEEVVGEDEAGAAGFVGPVGYTLRRLAGGGGETVG
jgi:hypothetical protein